MEIFTLLKANIRKKKGSFISIIILTAIVAAVSMTILGVKQNYHEGMERALEVSDTGDIIAFARPSDMNEEQKKKVEESPLVERVVYYDAICENGRQVGKHSDSNSGFMMEMREGIKVYNEAMDGFLKEAPQLKAGEIYLPLGLKSKLSCDVGDTIAIDLIMGIRKEFTIRGFVQEPANGAMLIGWKQEFISREDFDTILKECHAVQTEDVVVDVTVAMVYQNPESGLTATKFQRELNLETKIVTNSLGALTKDQSKHYSMLMTDVVLNVVLVFAIFLFVIVLIVMMHSINTEIQIDYVTLGVLKSQGFTGGKLRRLFLWQYGLAELSGIVIGSLIAMPLQRVVGDVCRQVTGILPLSDRINLTGILLMGGIIVVSFLMIYISTMKVTAISPVRAISGGREEIYFDHFFQCPISKKMLAVSLAFRQFTSAKKRYAGIMVIVAILTFFMVTANLVDNLLVPENAGDAMGMVIPDIEVWYEKKDVTVDWEEMDRLVAESSKVKDKNSVTNGYLSLNGENLYCEVYAGAESIPGILEGRTPLYDNEILITELVAEALELEMGDKVLVSQYDKEAEYMISGIYQTMSDTGMAFSMNGKGVERLKEEKFEFNNRYYVVEDKTQLTAIEQKIKEIYGDSLGVFVFTEDNNPIINQYGDIVQILKVIINVFSLLFAAVAVRMVCTKTFLQERTDIGIYKAVGFTSNALRRQFAARFFLVSLAGAGFGILLSFLLSEKAFGLIFRLTGVTKLSLVFTFGAVAVPVLIISASCMIFAFIAASKVKRVEIRELVVE